MSKKSSNFAALYTRRLHSYVREREKYTILDNK